jgi:hypothetical protein
MKSDATPFTNPAKNRPQIDFHFDSEHISLSFFDSFGSLSAFLKSMLIFQI